MENNIAIIKNEPDKTMSIKIKDSDMSPENVLSTVIVIMEWCQARHKVDAQKVMDAIKSKTFFSELVYGGADIPS